MLKEALLLPTLKKHGVSKWVIGFKRPKQKSGLNRVKSCEIFADRKLE